MTGSDVYLLPIFPGWIPLCSFHPRSNHCTIVDSIAKIWSIVLGLLLHGLLLQSIVLSLLLGCLFLELIVFRGLLCDSIVLGLLLGSIPVRPFEGGGGSLIGVY